ncbi:hypothetical protein ACOAQN_13735 [Pseudomonas aeruginosa]
MSNELTDVRCPCGDEYPADSYDAGFIAGSGMCQNCDAALPPKDICTCPSGDGSLRHPCPAHPAVEQAGANVGHGHVFPRADGVKMRCGGPGLCSECTADASRARAALAQPSPAGEYGDAYQGAREDIAIWKRRALEAEQALRQAHNGQTFMGEPLVQPYEAPREKVNALFKVLGFSGTASVGDILDAALERLQAQPSPAQAEAERPEVVAWQYRVTAGPQTGWSLWHPGKGEEFERSYTVERRPLMTVAQHERIVGELRAVIAQLRQHKNDYMDSGQETYRALQNEIREREAEIARLDGLVSGRTAERDAALARVAELEKQERPEGPTEDELEAAGLGYPLHKEEAVKLWYSGFRSEVITVLEAWEAIGHDIGMNPDKGELLDSLRYMLEKCEAHDAALARVAELERQQPVAWMHDQPNRVDVIHRDVKDLLQRVPGSSRGIYRPLDVSEHYTIPLYAAPVAQAQHSVPDGWVQSLPLKDHQPCKPNEDRANGYTIPIYSRPVLVEEALRKLRAVLCDPIGNVVIDGSDGDREEVQRALGMLAAAPGKEGNDD